jgi:hypothetical protein
MTSLEARRRVNRVRTALRETDSDLNEVSEGRTAALRYDLSQARTLIASAIATLDDVLCDVAAFKAAP